MTELQAAAERYKANGAPYDMEEINGEPTGYVRILGGLWDDATDLADAYLRDNRADDGEAVTKSWLESVGFKGDVDNATAIEQLQCWTDDAAPSADEWQFNGAIIPSPKTHGDVRQLCAALGIPLTEQGAG